MSASRPPRISVVLTTHDSERFLEEQLTSLLRQTHRIDELVVGDDASKDATTSILDSVLSGAPFDVDVKLHREHIGFLRNVDTTLRRTTGDIVCFADHDDVWRDDKVESIVDALAGRTGAAVFSNGRIVNDGGTVQRADLWSRVGLDDPNLEAIRQGDGLRVLLARPIVTGASLACTRDVALRSLPFPASAVHDQWMSLVAVTTGDLVPIDSKLFDYRVHDANTIGLGSSNPFRVLQLRLQDLDVPARAAATLSVLVERFGALMTPEDRVLLERAITHHRTRSGLPDRWWPRALAATRDLTGGGYRGHHASPSKSWIYDVAHPFLPSAGFE